LGVWQYAYRDKKVVGVFVRFSCAAKMDASAFLSTSNLDAVGFALRKYSIFQVIHFTDGNTENSAALVLTTALIGVEPFSETTMAVTPVHSAVLILTIVSYVCHAIVMVLDS
jgi:hypothetical protein